MSHVLKNGNVAHSFNAGDLLFDQTTAKYYEQIITVGTSEEDISFGAEITTAGVVVLRNLEASGGNFVKYGPKSAGSMIELGRILPLMPLRLYIGDSSIILRMVADTASVELQVITYEV